MEDSLRQARNNLVRRRNISANLSSMSRPSSCAIWNSFSPISMGRCRLSSSSLVEKMRVSRWLMQYLAERSSKLSGELHSQMVLTPDILLLLLTTVAPLVPPLLSLADPLHGLVQLLYFN